MHIIWMIFFLSVSPKKISFRTRKKLSFEKDVLLRNVVVVTNYSFGKTFNKISRVLREASRTVLKMFGLEN
jgi:hypothetical protein